MITFGSVFSGIEAASVAFDPLGWKPVWFSEIEGFPSAVLAHHYPEVPNLGDMTQLAQWVKLGLIEAPDVLCGGSPCQAFSVAGLRQSLDDARGNLTLKFVELADAIDNARTQRGEEPAAVLWENVPGVLTTKDNAFGCFLAGIAGETEPLVAPGGKWANAGVVLGPKRAVAWRTLDAQYFGLAQRRRRVFVVASARNGFDPAQVLFEWDSVRRDSAPSREAGERVANALTDRADRGGTNSEGQRLVTHSLRGEGFDASEDGTGRGTPLVPVAMINMQGSKGNAVAQADGPSFTLNAMHGHDMHAVAVPVGVTIHGTDPTVQKVASYDELAQCLRARTPGNIDNSSTTVVQQPVAYGIRTVSTSHPPAIAFNWNAQPAQLPGPDRDTSINDGLTCSQQGAVAQPVVHAIQAGALRVNPASGPDGVGVQADHAYTLEARAEVQAVQSAMQVRRLTPRECERLQGFPDDYTLIPFGRRVKPEKLDADFIKYQMRGNPKHLRREDIERLAADSPRYKALGNSWAVPCVRWIAERIDERLSHKR